MNAMAITFGVVKAPRVRGEKANAHISHDAEEGVAKIEGRDDQQRIQVWARNRTAQRFTMVFASGDFYLCDHFVKLLRGDDNERRRAVREAK